MHVQPHAFGELAHLFRRESQRLSSHDVDLQGPRLGTRHLPHHAVVNARSRVHNHVPCRLTQDDVVGVLIPREWVQTALGHDSGVRGIVLASAAGIATPAGPFVSLPIAATLLGAGAAPPAVIAYLSAWSLLALHRLLAWEVPILGARFALVRYAICIALPILAGLLARGLGRLS